MHIHSPFIEAKHVNLTYHNYQCLHHNYRVDNDNRNINCKCMTKIENTFEYTYLGLLVDCNFKWDKHINNICKRLRSSLYAITILSQVVNTNILYIVYFALCESILRYGILTWGRTTEGYINEIVRIQNQILKRIHPNLDENSKILGIKELYKYVFVITHYYSDKHKNCIQHEHETRNKNRFVLPKEIYNKYGEQTRKYLIPKIFNELPHTLLKLQKISRTKKLIHSFYEGNIDIM